jgi:hypothetical protein
MYKVKVQARGFNGVRANVRFKMGVGEFTDEKLIPVFERMGYEVIKPEAEVKEEPKKKAPAKKKATSKKKGE